MDGKTVQIQINFWIYWDWTLNFNVDNWNGYTYLKQPIWKSLEFLLFTFK